MALVDHCNDKIKCILTIEYVLENLEAKFEKDENSHEEK